MHYKALKELVNMQKPKISQVSRVMVMKKCSIRNEIKFNPRFGSDW